MMAYHQPRTLDHALQLLGRRSGMTIIAGCTDVYPAKTARAGWGHMAHPDVLDISQIAFARGVVQTPTGWSLSPLTTWSDVIQADLPPLFDGLKAAAREVGGVQIQNRGTLVGNLCTASPAADGVPCLLALDAEVEIESAEALRRTPLAEFISGYRQTTLAPHEMVIGLHIPRQRGSGYFIKLGARRYLVISIAMVSGMFDVADDGTVRAAKIAVGACSAVAQRLPNLEARLLGNPLHAATVWPADLAHLAPISDIRGSGAYRGAAALQLVRDIIAAAVETGRIA
jgi:xanthine dehydrogenase small subunit